jgi:hypothetical protein
MKILDKLAFYQDNHWSEWIAMYRKVEEEISDKQSMFCVCGRLATGLHERGCSKFRSAVIKETVKRLEISLPIKKDEDKK